MFAEGRPYTVISQSPPFALSISNEPDNELVVGRLSEGGNDEKVRLTMTPLLLFPPSVPDPPPQWIVTGEGPDTYIIKNVANGKFLGVEGEPREGVRVIAADSPTFWRIEAEGSGFYGYR